MSFLIEIGSETGMEAEEYYCSSVSLIKKEKRMGNEDDWQKTKHKRNFPYTGTISNKKYLKDRAELFAKSGNGWWWWQGTFLGQNIGKENEEKAK